LAVALLLLAAARHALRLLDAVAPWMRRIYMCCWMTTVFILSTTN